MKEGLLYALSGCLAAIWLFAEVRAYRWKKMYIETESERMQGKIDMARIIAEAEASDATAGERLDRIHDLMASLRGRRKNP